VSFYDKLATVKGIKTVPPENLHITLDFLGEVAEAGISDLAEKLMTIAAQESPFTLEIKGVGAFPSLTAPKTLWVAMEQKKALFDLAKRIKRATDSLDRKRFSPHLTIGRVKYKDSSQSRFYNEFIKQENYSFGRFPVDSFFLMKSDLSGKTPVYTVVKEFKIKDGEKQDGKK
jgi:2'-5' RNA ligase